MDWERLLLAGRGHALLVRMVHDLRKILGLQRVEHVEEVLARRTFAGGIGGREVGAELGVLLQLGPEAADRELVILRHLNGVDVGLLHQLLLAGEHILEKVFVDDGLVG